MDRRFRYKLSKFLLPIIGILLLVYFTYHIIRGNHGWLSWKELEQDLKQSKQELAALEKTKAKIKNKVQLLRSDSLDEDMLDERARAMLGVAKGHEVVIIDASEEDA